MYNNESKEKQTKDTALPSVSEFVHAHNFGFSRVVCSTPRANLNNVHEHYVHEHHEHLHEQSVHEQWAGIVSGKSGIF